ncbi:MAG: hypothetical protein JNJ90_10690 [Saprospiraceae bacterium]|jgi:hypothetical protein|nr:hypothetical protein [Saprospiraceae bacterium]
MAPDLKHQSDFDQLSIECPPSTCQPDSLVAFRWVFEDMQDNRNFTPVFFLNPNRFLTKNDDEKCRAMGLSMFTTSEYATTRFEFLLRVIGNAAYERFGTHVANCRLLELDGVNSKPDGNGHFTNYPVENHEYPLRFVVIKHL